MAAKARYGCSMAVIAGMIPGVLRTTVNNRQLHPVGGILTSVRDAWAWTRVAPFDFLAAQRYLSAVAVEERQSRRGAGRRPPLVAPHERMVIEVALGLLRRGSPTLSSPQVERALLRSLTSDTLRFTELDGSAIEFVLEPRRGNMKSEEWSALLSYAHLPVDPRATWSTSLPFDSPEEREFFCNHLAPTLGDAAGFLEMQRPPATMVPAKLAKQQGGLVDQRVDFALESPGGARIVIEVDGGQHEDDPDQVKKDEDRDELLSGAGWQVFRIPTRALNNRRQPDLSLIKKAVSQDCLLAACMGGAANTLGDSATGRDIARLVLTPHAVARVQLGLLLLLAQGRLGLRQATWHLAVVERDVPCATLAVLDLLELLRHLCDLYDVPFETEVQLSVVRHHGYRLADPELSGFDEGLRNRVRSSELNTVQPSDTGGEIVLDVSVRARPTQEYDEFDPDDLVGDCASHLLILRTAHRRRPTQGLHWSPPLAVAAPEAHPESLAYFLQLLFRKREFRDGQLPIIHRALRRESTIGLLPTGAGKSITFQLPTLLSPGFAVVVDPLKSLIQDQLENLTLTGIDVAVGVHSDLTPGEREEVDSELEAGDPRFVFVAPERLQMRGFRSQLGVACSKKPTSFVVVDEAHCVSEWGHDFRTSYLNLGRLARTLCRFRDIEPPLLALTGTASRSVLADVQREIAVGVEDPSAVISPSNFDRPELFFLVDKSTSEDKPKKLVAAVSRVAQQLGIHDAQLFSPEHAGLVFCRHVNGAFGVVGVQERLTPVLAEYGVQPRLFAGKPPKTFKGSESDWRDEKRSVQREFKENGFPLLVATSAFGMGIDKPNIRYTIHFGIPPSLEAFSQEAGRAGRDRERAVCVVLFSDDNLVGERNFLDVSLPAEEANVRYKKHFRFTKGDLGRLMYFHSEAYIGAAREFEQVCRVFRGRLRSHWEQVQLSIGEQSSLMIPYGHGEGDEQSTERAVYRLSLLGLVTDYTKDSGARQLEVTTAYLHPAQVEARLLAYVRRYKAVDYESTLRAQLRSSDLTDPYERAIEALTWFVYEEIEKKRRTALKIVADVMREANDGEDLRRALNDYLSESIFTRPVTELMDRIDPHDWWSIFADVASPEDASQLLGQCRRGLESYPDHPGLHLLTGMARSVIPGTAPKTVAESFLIGFKSLESTHGWEASRLEEVASEVAVTLHRQAPELFDPITDALVRVEKSSVFARAAYRWVSDPGLRRACALPYLVSIARHVERIPRSQLEV